MIVSSRREPVGAPLYRIRIGTYRVVYEIDDNRKTVTIVTVGHRGDVYR